jgi:hypothetical protein
MVFHGFETSICERCCAPVKNRRNKNLHFSDATHILLQSDTCHFFPQHKVCNNFLNLESFMLTFCRVCFYRPKSAFAQITQHIIPFLFFLSPLLMQILRRRRPFGSAYNFGAVGRLPFDQT